MADDKPAMVFDLGTEVELEDGTVMDSDDYLHALAARHGGQVRRGLPDYLTGADRG